jgi:hypothetical protein
MLIIKSHFKKGNGGNTMRYDDNQVDNPKTKESEGYTTAQARIIGILKFLAWSAAFIAMIYVMHGPQI